MSDPRVAKLGELLVNYSLALKPGQLVRIDGNIVAGPPITQLYRYALRAGAYPRTRIEVEDLEGIALSEANDEQLTFISALDRQEVEELYAVVTIWADRNTRALTGADAGRVSRRIGSRRQLVNRFWERIDADEATW